MGLPGPFPFSLFKQILQQLNVKNVHPVYGAVPRPLEGSRIDI